MSYWIFKANPENYRIDERLLDPKPNITWAVTRYHDRIKKDDIVFIWRTGTPRGICAIVEIEDCPYQPDLNEINDGFEIPSGSIEIGVDHWAKGHFTKRFPLIDASVIKKIEGLELFSFFSAFQQAINFSITRPEGSILFDFIEKYEADTPENNSEGNEKKAVRTKRQEPLRVIKTKKSEPLRAPKNKKTKSGVSTRGTSDISLLKCDLCGRYVVSTDADRHIRDTHPGDSVEWKKVN